MVLPAYGSWLRVYEPLAAFPEPDRAGWLTRVRGGGLEDRRAAARRELELIRRASLRGSLSVVRPGEPEPALAATVDGITYLCPLDLQQRVWEAAASLRDGLPPLMADALLPAARADEARLALAAARGTGRMLRAAHLRSARWVVPLAWFALVDVADRVRSVDDVFYRTPLGAARRRAAQALEVLAHTIPQAPTARALAELAEWLAAFHAHALLELDYGSVAELLTAEQRRDDASPGDLAEALRELTAGRALPAAAAYERVLARWRPLQQRETSS